MKRESKRPHSHLYSVKLFAFLVGVMLVASSCVPQDEVEDLVNVPGADLPTLPNLDVACYQDVYAPKEEDITRNIDILVIPDTSASIISERAQIAEGFNAFLDVLPSAADVNIAVMLGHGSGSTHFGKLYTKSTEPTILSNRSLTIEEIKTHLRTKMENPAGDYRTDGGEAGLASLNRALEDDYYSSIQGQGFFREDAALVVVFVADEQDICAIYPEGVTPVPDPQGGEDRSRLTECFDGETQIVTPKSVLDKLKARYTDRPLVTGGVIYNNLSTIPFGGENEIGYGYKEFVEFGGGFTVDMATGEYGDGLSKLGTLAMSRIDPVNSFNLEVTNIDTNTIRTFVDGKEVQYSYDTELNIVSLNEERGPFSIAAVQYCEKPSVTKQVIQIVAGGSHSCALIANGEVKCWGDNSKGQLGQGDTVNRGDDEGIDSIPAIDLNGELALQVIAGNLHTCILTESNKVKCFGDNTYGQLGMASTDTLGDDEQLSEYGYTEIGGIVRKLYGGTYHNCALLTTGDVRCWGQNYYGQLGTGDTEIIGDDETPAQGNLVALGAKAIQMDISSMSFHACAILSGGTLKCWGRGTHGQLGLGNTDNVNSPSLATPTPKGVIAVTTGGIHTCALLSDSTVYCFGNNSQGQLGDGTSEAMGDNETLDNHTALDLGFEVASVVASNTATCALSKAGDAKCWGNGTSGKLGQVGTAKITGDLANLPAIELGKSVSQVSGGLNHHCFLTTDEGLVKCIGNGSKGQLGNGNTDSIGDDESPVLANFLALFNI
ncbi:hypothetical protein ABMA70_12055 [Halobacteriovorax sp. XZX-3]|uniref:RCC1 domain-containing protein n=1 Tax=unclassified Halobacteriovorax TaxID=2639665 RepID=UPI0037208BB3